MAMLRSPAPSPRHAVGAIQLDPDGRAAVRVGAAARTGRAPTSAPLPTTTPAASPWRIALAQRARRRPAAGESPSTWCSTEPARRGHRPAPIPPRPPRAAQPANTVVLGIAPSGGGRPRWWVRRRSARPAPLPRGAAQRSARRIADRGAAAARRPASRARRDARLRGPSTAAAGDRDRLPRRARTRAALASSSRHAPSSWTRKRSTAQLQFGLLLVDAIGALRRARAPGRPLRLHRRDRIALGRPLPVLARRPARTGGSARRAGPRAGSRRRRRAPRPGAGCRCPRRTRGAAPRSAAARSSGSSIACSWL